MRARRFPIRSRTLALPPRMSIAPDREAMRRRGRTTTRRARRGRLVGQLVRRDADRPVRQVERVVGVDVGGHVMALLGRVRLWRMAKRPVLRAGRLCNASQSGQAGMLRHRATLRRLPESLGGDPTRPPKPPWGFRTQGRSPRRANQTPIKSITYRESVSVKLSQGRHQRRSRRM
jgi:hypothetical protein